MNRAELAPTPRFVGPSTGLSRVLSRVHRSRCDLSAGMGRGCGERTPRSLCPLDPAPGGFDRP